MTRDNGDGHDNVRYLRNGGRSASGPGKSKSDLTLGQRRSRSKKMYAQGYTVSEVSRSLHISMSTASKYHQQYLEQIELQARQNPHLLRDVIKNTFTALGELDLIRKNLWRRYYRAKNDPMRAQFLNLLLKAQDQRAKLLGLFGVKAEYMAMVHNVSMIQKALLEFMQEELCEEDRKKLEQFLLTKMPGQIHDGEILADVPAGVLAEGGGVPMA